MKERASQKDGVRCERRDDPRDYLLSPQATEGCADHTYGQGGFGEETYGGTGLEHVRQVGLGVCRDQYDRGRCRVVDLLKSLREIEAAFFSDIYIDQCYVGSQLLDGPERVGIR